MVHGRRLSTFAIAFLAILLAFGQVLAVGAEEAESIVQPEPGQEEQASDEPVRDDVAEIPAGDEVLQPEAGEQPLQEDPVAIEQSSEETGALSGEASGSGEDSAITAAETGQEPAPSDADVGIAGEDEEQPPLKSDEASPGEAPIDEPQAGVEAPQTSSPAETGAPMDSMQSTRIQQLPDTQMEVAASTLSVSNLVLTCDGMFGFDVAAASTGVIGYGIVAHRFDGSSPTVQHGTRPVSGVAETISITFAPHTNALSYSGYLMDMATQVVIGETTSPACQQSPAAVSIARATCAGEVRAAVSEGSAPGSSVVAFFYAYGLDPDGWTQEVYDLRLSQDYSGPGEYVFPFAVAGYPADLSPVTVDVAVAFYDGDRSVGDVAALTLDCTGANMPDEKDPGLATIEIVEATCDGSVTIRISEGDFVADAVYARLFGLKDDGDAVGLLQDTYLTYTGPGEYEVSFELPRFDIDVQPETFVAVYSFSNQYTGQVIEASIEVPDCPNPWYVPVDVPQETAPLTIEIIDATCDGRAVIRLSNGDEGDHAVTASFGMAHVDNQPIDGFLLEQVIPYTGPGEHEVVFDLQMLDVASLPDTFIAGYGFVAHDDGKTIEAGRILEPCAKADLWPGEEPVPSPDVDPILDDSDEVAVTPDVVAPAPVELVATGAEPLAAAPAPDAPSATRVDALPSTGDGDPQSQRIGTWMVLTALALIAAATGASVRDRRA